MIKYLLLRSLLPLTACGWGSDRMWTNVWGEDKELCERCNNCEPSCGLYGNCDSGAAAPSQDTGGFKACELYGNCE